MRLSYLLALLLLCAEANAAENLRIVNIRVGQGDATLIQGPTLADEERVNVLVDAGDINNRDGGHILRAVLNKNGVEKLNFMIMTHSDADHIGGIGFGGFHGKSIILGFDDAVGCVGDDDNDGNPDWLPGEENVLPDPEELGQCDDLEVLNWVDYGETLFSNSQASAKYNGLANAMGVRHTLNDQASVDGFEIDLGAGAVMTAYAANGFVRGGDGEPVENVNTPNERSLSFLVTFGDFDFLISGDLIGQDHGSEDAFVEEAVADAIIENDRTVDVLHVNHHGANNGSEEVFLSKLQPNIAVISAGNGNSHKHPHNSVLKRLVNADVYRIILTSFGTSSSKISSAVRDHFAVFQHDVVIESDGEIYEVSTKRGYRADKNCVHEPSQCSRGASLDN